MKDANIEGNPGDPSTRQCRLKAVYEKRWQKIREATLELDAVSLEAEAIWGQVVKENLFPLIHCAGTLYSSLGFYLDNLEHKYGNISEKLNTRSRQIIYDAQGEKDNFFSNEITEAVGKIEKFLKPHLKI